MTGKWGDVLYGIQSGVDQSYCIFYDAISLNLC